MKRKVRGLRRSNLTVIVIALAAIVLAVFQLQRGDDGLSVTTLDVGNTPATIFRPQSSAAAPVIVIAHGFAGSQQLMQPFALTLARNGYVVVTFDFLGHGRNPEPMRGDITKETGITEALLAELGRVADVARALPQSDGRLAVLGHSMASDVVVKYAMANPSVQATVAVSVFSKVATATSPRNLLVIVGALEPAMLRDEGLRIVGLAAGGPAEPGKIYGDFANGSARRMVEARGVEHIGVLYGRDGLNAALAWFNGAFDRNTAGFIDARGPWLALLFGGIVVLAWPLSRLLPVFAPSRADARWSWGRLSLAAIGPAVLTPLILWKLPTEFLSILLGDYLTLHFLIYGALTGATVVLLRGSVISTKNVAWKNVALAALAVAAFNVVAFGVPIDTWLFSFWPVAPRWPVIAVIACGTVPYFIADEVLTAQANRTGGYALTKLCFLVSLALAILLNPMKLFFLAIIVPAVLVLFLIFGTISRVSLRATGHPLPGAIGNAALFAWAIGVTFPMVMR